MVKIKEAIVVEGRYDKNTLSQIVDAPILETNGFGIFKDKQQMALLRQVAERRGENGEMLTHNSIKFLSRIIRDDLHIPFKFHNLRHTYATILAESGISPRYVQEMLGHSKLEFTLKYYTHITGHMAPPKL